VKTCRRGREQQQVMLRGAKLERQLWGPTKNPEECGLFGLLKRVLAEGDGKGHGTSEKVTRRKGKKTKGNPLYVGEREAGDNKTGRKQTRKLLLVGQKRVANQVIRCGLQLIATQ